MAAEWRGTLADLARESVLSFGDGYRTKQSELGLPGFPILRVAQIADGFIDRSGIEDYVREEFRPAIGPKLSQVDDVVLTTKGTFGRRAIVRSGAAGMVYSPQVCYFRVTNRARIDPRYLYYWLGSDAFGAQAVGLIAQTDMAAYLSLRDLARVKLALPAVDEQRRIGHILGALDDKIELNRRMSETLESMARALFKSWFIDFDPVHSKAEGRNHGLPGVLADLFPDSLEQSEVGRIPRGWRVGTLGDVADHPRRGVEPDDIPPCTPYIGLEHMPRRSIALTDWGYADELESNKFEFRTREILFGKLRPYFHKVGVAPVGGVCSTDIVVLAPRTPPWMAFVLGLVSSDAFIEHTNAGSTGTKMPRTSWGEMARYAVALPPEPVAQAFTDLMQGSLDRILLGIHESRSCAALRDTLLPRLVSGQLAIGEMDALDGAGSVSQGSG